jgi:adenosylcobinamide amidohydrolase
VLAPRRDGTGSLALALLPRWLVVRFTHEHEVTSWAPVRGGCRRASAVAWHEVSGDELLPGVDPGQLLGQRLAQVGLEGAVGLLTSRPVDRYVSVVHRLGPLSAEVVGTVGLGNALRAGDAPAEDLGPHPGTINLLCRLSTPLRAEAALEALSIAAESRTMAMLESNVPSRRSGLPATGTGTDCIAIAAPVGREGALFAGKHTAIGHLVGASVTDAVRVGIAGWLADQQGGG